MDKLQLLYCKVPGVKIRVAYLSFPVATIFINHNFFYRKQFTHLFIQVAYQPPSGHKRVWQHLQPLK